MPDPHPNPGALDARPAPRAAARPRVYVACLAAYNNGRLHGRWIAATTPDDVREDVRAMLAASPEPGAEEWAIHDYEGFEGAHLEEYASFERVCDLADFIAEHGALGARLLAEHSDDLAAARAAFEDYAGVFRSAAEFAEDLHDETGTVIPESLRPYIDWEALARDMALNGDIIVIETGFEEAHIFWAR